MEVGIKIRKVGRAEIRKSGWKKEKKLSDVTSHIYYVRRPPTLRYPHQSCCVGWCPEDSQPCQVSSKLVQGYWLPQVSLKANLHFKFEVSSFSSYSLYSGSPKTLKVGHMTSFQPPLM